MNFRSRDTLQAWLTEFQQLDYPSDRTLRVIEQDGADGADTGLVALQLAGGLSAYVQPDRDDTWVLTFEHGEESFELDAATISRLSSELATVSALCGFLQAKSTTTGD
jgi:hypothetical protein